MGTKQQNPNRLTKKKLSAVVLAALVMVCIIYSYGALYRVEKPGENICR